MNSLSHTIKVVTIKHLPGFWPQNGDGSYIGVFGDRQYKSLAWSKPSFTVHSLHGGFVSCQLKFNSPKKLYFAGMVRTLLRGYLPITKNSISKVVLF